MVPRLDICVLACSKGAEVYSILWAIRSARPDLRLTLHAVDISQEILEFAERGVYSLDSSDVSKAPKSNDVDWKRKTWTGTPAGIKSHRFLSA